MDYHLGIAGQQEGPVAEEEIVRRIAAGTIAADDLCWTDGWSNWKPVVEVFPQAFPHRGPPVVPPTIPRATRAPAPKRSTTPKTSGLAVTSLVLGLLAFIFWILTAIPAIICGHLARSKIRKSGGAYDGAGVALAGLILGYVFLVMGLGVSAAILIPALSNVRETTRYTVSQSNVRQLVQMQLLFANDHDGRLANSVDELRDFIGPSIDEVMDLPYTDEIETDGYTLVSGVTTAMPSDTVVVLEAQPRRDGRVAVGYLAGYVDLVFPGLERPPPPSFD